VGRSRGGGQKERKFMVQKKRGDSGLCNWGGGGGRRGVFEPRTCLGEDREVDRNRKEGGSNHGN